MATDLMPSEVSDRGSAKLVSTTKASLNRGIDFVALLRPLASLKFTVALFALAVFLVFAGTLAQTRNDIWWVVYNYFRTWVAWVELKVFFPPAWFSQYPHLINMPGSFPFPGGLTIGGLMAINLLAAHGLRFTVQARGVRLAIGLAVVTLGCLLAWLVIASGPNSEGMQAAMPLDWKWLWRGFLIGLGLTCVGIAAALFTLGENRRPQRILLGLSGSILLAVWAYLLFKIDVNSINPEGMISAMRVLWQLIQAGVPSLVLLAGCILLFRKRAGIVLLHAGIGLIMANELIVFAMHRETRMQIIEGETTNFTQDLRTYELAIVDEDSSPTHDKVVVVSEDALQRSLESGKPFSHPDLPFNVQLKEFYPNSGVREAKSDDKWVVETPTGKLAVVSESPAAGADNDAINIPAGRVEFTDKETGAVLAEHPLSVLFPVLEKANQPDSQVRVGDRAYRVTLQFEKQYRPYSVHLYKVTRKNYPGTTTPQSYSSEFQLVDPTRGTDRRMVTRMNEPIRYGGATIYQSGNPAPGITVFQIVDNFGWMIPYVGCMIVGIGMLAHFSLVLTRFIQRREEGRIEVGDALWGDREADIAAVATSQKPTKGKHRRKKDEAREAFSTPSLATWIGKALPFVAGAVVIALLIRDARSPSPQKTGEMDLYSFGQLPIEAGGRILPADSLARNYLRLISLREAYLESAGFDWKQHDGMLLVTRVHPGSPAAAAGLKAGDRIESIDGRQVKGLAEAEIEELLEGVDATKISMAVKAGDKSPRTVSLTRSYRPAIKWLLDWAAVPGLARKHRVFRIENPDVLNALKLERRKYFRYSWDEISRNQDEFHRLRTGLKGREAASYSIFEKKISELGNRVDLQNLLAASFQPPTLPELPTREDLQADPEAINVAVEQLTRWKNREFPAFEQALAEFHPPHAIPTWPSEAVGVTASDDENHSAWNTYSVAFGQDFLRKIPLFKTGSDPLQKQVGEALRAWESMFDAYAAQDAGAFNHAVKQYSRSLDQDPPVRLSEANSPFEAWFNYWHPFLTCQWTYFAAFCFAALGWLGWKKPLNRTAFVLILIAFVVHTAALCFRMYISGRPPVTNLYSSAIFIGWAAVLAGLILESVYRMGFGNVLASVAGYCTLLIADKLALSIDQSRGDTVGVMQAVLDTQFWLATHVTTITLGYTATFVAGLLGLIYVIRGVCTRELAESEGKNLARMIYGTVCFGIFFSFVGTVLGGLWADDSWGRFWGWDPKENGALLIVLWNAIILHARWGGMIKDRGMALLAIGGNIVTAWSWFGVNQLGVGLHSYGFTEGVVLALGVFVLSQLAIIAVGLIPTKYWLSHRAASAA